MTAQAWVVDASVGAMLVCIALTLVLAAGAPSFLRYDSRHPTP